MAKSGISKLDYLKKYMDGDDSKKEKKVKKKKKVKKQSNIKIIDNSIPLRSIDANLNSEEEGEYDLQEERPLMYAEDGMTVISNDNSKEEAISRWKPLNDKSYANDFQRIKSQKQSMTHKTALRHDSSDDDLSPVHQNKRSPKVLRRHDSSDSDMSPVRQPRDRHDTSDSDMSPVRKKKSDSTDDLSRVRKKKLNSDDDLSPQRTSQKSQQTSSDERRELQPEVLSTGKAGLRSGEELRRENELKRKYETEKMKNLKVEISGRGAETVQRDRKTGKKIDLKLEAIKKRKMEEELLEHEEKYAKWGKGLAQVDDYQKKIKDDLHEMEKPLARYKDDKDLDVLLRERDREGDPMLAFLSKTRNKEEKPSKPRYKGPTPAPNRFNIWPGCRYDGVDRSNGFEKRRFLEINKRKTYKDAAYKWSVEEM